MSRLMASLDAPPSGRERPVWFDAADYGRAKLLAGAVPWSSPAELVAFFGKLQNMFRSDAILVELADLLAQRVSGDEGLRTAMAARTRRPGYALRTLLADEQARATAVEAIGAVAATKGTVPAADRTGAGPLARAGGPAGAVGSRIARPHPGRRSPRCTSLTSCGYSLACRWTG